MSNFTKDDLFEIYNKYLPTFVELAQIAVKNNISFEIDTSASGRIEITSRHWDECEKGGKLLTKHFIRQMDGSIGDGSETTHYES